MLIRQLERISRASTLDSVVIATSEDASDDALAALVEASPGVHVVRGSLDDVLARFVSALEMHDCDVVVRLTADCPLVSPHVIDQVVEEFHSSDADYVSNTLDPTYPDGLDVEVMTSASLREIAAISEDPDEREHVTLGIYRRPHQYILRNFVDPLGRNNSHMRWTVDSADDFSFVTAVYEDLASGLDTFEYEDVLSILNEHPELIRTSADQMRNAALNGLDTGAMVHQHPEEP